MWVEMAHFVGVMVAQKIIQFRQGTLYVLIAASVDNIDFLVRMGIVKLQRMLDRSCRRSARLLPTRSARRDQEKHRPSHPHAQVVLSHRQHPFLSTSILT